MSKYRIRINGKTYEMEIEAIDDKEVTHMSKTVLDVSFNVNAKKDPIVQVINPEAEKQTNFDNNTVLSPMPGSIIKILVSEGDKVSSGQPVLILEAMKMENEIVAPKTGVIKKIFVEEGHAVQGSIPLFEMELEG